VTEDVEALKHQAALEAMKYVEDGMVLGLGTGSTAAHFLDLLGRAVADGLHVVGVPTSIHTDRRARELGIPLSTLAEHPRLDLTVDGADEVTPSLDLIKGMGGALLREKMVAQASARFVIVADASKGVEQLGSASPLPLEVVDWNWLAHIDFLEALGAEPSLRRGDDDAPVKSDNGNLLVDCRFARGIADPVALEGSLARRAGILETGLFLAMATDAILAGPDGIRTLTSRERSE